MAPASPSPVAASEYLVSGTVIDQEGRPLEGVEVRGGVTLSKTSSTGFTVRTDGAGNYQGRLKPGSHNFAIFKPGYRDFRRDVVVAGDTTVDFRLQPGVYISGMISEWGLPLSLDSSVGVLQNATIEIIDGPNKGTKTISGDRVGTRDNYRFLDYVLPGTMRIRVTKEGFDPEERVISALENAYVDFMLKWTDGGCLASVSPILFDKYRSVGGTESVVVSVASGQPWRISTEDSWLGVESQSQLSGPGQFSFRISRHPIGGTQVRSGRLLVRCAQTGAQPVTVVQLPNCEVNLSATRDMPDTFPAQGGVGQLHMTVGTPSCEWEASSTVDWITTTGVRRWRGPIPGGQSGPAFVVHPNTTGSPRTGQLIVGETPWTVRQR